MRVREIRRTLAIILVANLAVVAVKIAVAMRTGALSVLGATVESALDAMNNVIAMSLVSIAALGPDEDHPYGHDKFESSAHWPLSDSSRSRASNWSETPSRSSCTASCPERRDAGRTRR